MKSIVLHDDAWRVRVLPESGGSLAECVFRGQTILQPVARALPSSDTEVCCYPLVPFSNRVEHSRFSFEGRTVRPRANLPGHPHAIHGHGWQAEWQLLQHDAGACALAYEHAASDDWPWRYRAQLSFAIDGHALAAELTLRNLSASRMPAGLGFHPFFPSPDSARLQAAARRIWRGAAQDFPRDCMDVPPDLDFARARPVRDARGLDHCYSDWAGSAAIDWPGAPHRVTVTAEAPLAHLLVFVPEGRNFFCVEPVSHAVNAFNFPAVHEHAPPALEPERELAARMTLRCEAVDRT